MKTNTHFIAAAVSIWLLLSGCSEDSQSPENTQSPNNADLVEPETTPHPLAKDSEKALGVVGKAKEEKHVKLTGTIIYKDIEGGFYAFISDNGDRYTLHGLDEAFQQNGLIVEVEGVAAPDMMTFTQFGTVLKVSNVKVLDASRIIDNAQTH